MENLAALRILFPRIPFSACFQVKGERSERQRGSSSIYSLRTTMVRCGGNWRGSQRFQLVLTLLYFPSSPDFLTH